MTPSLLVLGHSAALSGAELNLLRSLPVMGAFEVHVLLGEDGPLVGELRRCGVSADVAVLPKAASEWRAVARSGRIRQVRGALELAVYAVRLAGRLAKSRPDVIYTNSAKAHLYGSFLAIILRRPVVVHLHDRISPDLMSALNRRLMMFVAHRMATGIVANSVSTLRSAGLQESAGRCAVIPCALQRGIPQRSQVTDGPAIRFVLTGRLSPWKGQDLAIRAFARALQQLPQGSSLEIIGDSLFGETDYKEALQRLVRDLGLEDSVKLRGHVSDAPGQLQYFDVLIHSSVVPEPFGQVITEGLAAGLAVVAADAGGPAEIITHGFDGFLYPMNDGAALTEAMVRVGTSSTLRTELAQNGCRTAEKYASAKIVPMLEEFLGSFAGNERLTEREKA